MPASKRSTKHLQPQKLQETRPFLQKVADILPDLLFVLDLDDREIVYINNSVEQLLGHSASHVYEKGHEVFREVLHPADYERRMAHIEACKSLQDNEEKEIEVRMKTGNGHWSWFKVRDNVFKRKPDGTVAQTIGIAHCIQDQVAAREKRKVNEALLRQTEQVGQIGSYEIDVISMQINVSDGFYRLFGYEPNGFVPSIEFIDSVSEPEDAQAVMEVLEQAIQNKQPYEYRRRIYQSNGQMRCLSSKGKVITDAAGNTVKLLGIVEDVTDQVRTNQILDSINEVCFELDKDFKLTYANRRAYQVWNKRPEEILGKSFWEVFPEDMGTPVEDTLLKAAEGGVQVLTEVYCPAIGRWIFLNANPSPTGLIVLHFDVTEQVKAKLEIQEFQEQLKTLVENIPDIVTRWDGNLKLQFANTALEALTGFPNARLYGRSLLEISMFHDIAPSWIESLKRVFATGNAEDKSDTFTWPVSGTTNYYYSRLVPEPAPEGGVQTVLAISRDITEQKKIQEALLEAEKLSIKGKLARTIAHEVRGPLVNISLALELLQQEPGAIGEVEKAQPYSSIISKSCNRIDAFITELLNLSKAEARAYVPTKLSDLVKAHYKGVTSS